MSMSEFERQENTEGDESFPVAIRRLTTPPNDFTEEDLAFARELNALFSLEEENLPPYYVQTLLDVDDQRFEPVPREFEHKTSARVFRRLKLRRRLFYTHVSPLHALSMGIRDTAMRRSLLATVGAFLLVMLLTVAFTGSSFATGGWRTQGNSAETTARRAPLGGRKPRTRRCCCQPVGPIAARILLVPHAHAGPLSAGRVSRAQERAYAARQPTRTVGSYPASAITRCATSLRRC